MNETCNAMIIKQMRTLLDQLEKTEKSTFSTNASADEDDTLTSQLLRLSCDQYWIYDPLNNAVDLYFVNDKKEQDRRIVRSMSALQRDMDVEDCKRISEAFKRMMTGNSYSELFQYSEKKKGTCKSYDVSAQCCELDGHKKIIGITRIINELSRSFNQAVQAQQKFELLMGLSSTYIWEYNIEEQTFSANHSLCKKLGLEERSYCINELSEKVEINELASFDEKLQKKELMEKAIVHIKSAEHSYDWIFESDFKAICNKYGDYVMLIGTMNDITEHEMLRTMASKDALTNCYNRNMADITLESSFKNYQESGESYTIIFFDIDKFKTVNDRYGHDMGDYVLSKVCERISEEIRSNDMMFRWGGDEFLMICRGISKENIYGYIDRLRKGIEFATFEFNGTKLQLTISIGAAVYYKTDEDYSFAMKRADRSLYKAKLAGRNKVCMLK